MINEMLTITILPESLKNKSNSSTLFLGVAAMPIGIRVDLSRAIAYALLPFI